MFAKNLPLKTKTNMKTVANFANNFILLLEEYRKEPGTTIPEPLDPTVMSELSKAAQTFIDSGLAGRLAALFPKSWGITQEVRYATLRRVNKKDYRGDAHIDTDFYTDKESPAYYGEEMECYASGETPEVILILEADEPTLARNPHLFWCKLPYDDSANEKWHNNEYDTTQLKEFDNLKTEVGVQDPGKTLIVVHAATHIDLIITDKSLRLSVRRQWLGINKGFARSLSRKTTVSGVSCVSGVGVSFGCQAFVSGDFGRAGGGSGLVLALTKR